MAKKSYPAPHGHWKTVYAVPVAGRVIRDVPTGVANALVAHAEAFYDKTKESFVCIPGGDFSRAKPESRWDCVLGLRAYFVEADEGRPEGPHPVRVFRDRIAALAPHEAFFREAAAIAGVPAEALLAQPAGLQFVATGPLSAGAIGFGVVAPAPIAGFEFWIGTTMQQERHTKGAAGVRLASVSMEGHAWATIDISDAAMAPILERTAALPGEPGLVFCAQFD